MPVAEGSRVCARALKEWAVQCLALATGRQALVLRKGGLREGPGGFAVEEEAFWLYPTGFHQSAEQLVTSAGGLVAEVARNAPPAGRVPLRWHARVVQSWRVRSLEQALAVQPWQILSPETVTSRFTYRQPGLWALLLSVTEQPETVWLEETESQRGCHSWVDLETPLPVTARAPVLSAQALAEVAQQLDHRLA